MNKTAQRAKKRGLRLTSVCTTPMTQGTPALAKVPAARTAEELTERRRAAAQSKRALAKPSAMTKGSDGAGVQGKGPCGVGSGETQSEVLPDDAEGNGWAKIISGAAAMWLAYATTDDVSVYKLVDAPSIQFNCDRRASQINSFTC